MSDFRMGAGSKSTEVLPRTNLYSLPQSPGGGLAISSLATPAGVNPVVSMRFNISSSTDSICVGRATETTPTSIRFPKVA